MPASYSALVLPSSAGLLILNSMEHIPSEARGVLGRRVEETGSRLRRSVSNPLAGTNE
jgi:hypothetical protein